VGAGGLSRLKLIRGYQMSFPPFAQHDTPINNAMEALRVMHTKLYDALGTVGLQVMEGERHNRTWMGFIAFLQCNERSQCCNDTGTRFI
jgi:hypothetical protein